MKTLLFIPALTVLALAPLAGAQSFDPRVGFRRDHANNGTPEPGPYFDILTMNGPAPLQALFGPFSAQGFSDGNRGLFNFVGTITLFDPAGTATISPATTPLRNPYNFGSVFQQVDPVTLTFDAIRGIGGITVPWDFGDQPPAELYTYPAAQGGPDAYFPGFRFLLDSPDGLVRTVTISVTGVMQAVDGWFVTSQEHPTDALTPGFQDLIPAGIVSAPVSTVLTVELNVPSPTAAVLLAITGLTVQRRRRA